MKPYLVHGREDQGKVIVKTLESCNSCITSFDLRMFKAIVNKFVFIMHFLNDK